MNHWNHLLHHSRIGVPRGPSDAAGLSDITASVASASPTVKIAGGAAIGLAAGHFMGKHAIIGALLGAAGGYYYASKTATATPATST